MRLSICSLVINLFKFWWHHNRHSLLCLLIALLHHLLHLNLPRWLAAHPYCRYSYKFPMPQSQENCSMLNPHPGTGSMSVRLREVAIISCSTSAFQANVSQLDTVAFFKARCALSLFHKAPINCDFLLDSDWSRHSIRCSSWKRCFWRLNFRCYLLHKLHRWHDHLCIDHLNGRTPHSGCHQCWR